MFIDAKPSFNSKKQKCEKKQKWCHGPSKNWFTFDFHGETHQETDQKHQ